MSKADADIEDFEPTLFARTNDHQIIARLHENGLSISFYATDPYPQAGEWEVKGFLKSDGCLNWMTDPECYAHLCEPGDLAQIAAIFEAVGRLAIKHMPQYEGNFGRALAGEKEA